VDQQHLYCEVPLPALGIRTLGTIVVFSTDEACHS